MDRNFVYLTGLKCKSAVLLAAKAANGQVSERLYLLPPDAQAERWTGIRVKPHEAAEKLKLLCAGNKPSKKAT